MSALLQAIIASSHLILVADKVPELNYEPSCKAAVQAAALQNRNENACIQDEKAARSKLEQEWGTFTPQEKSHCVQLTHTGGFPSYVELLTCVEMSKAAKNLPAGTNNVAPVERGSVSPSSGRSVSPSSGR